MKKRSQTSTEEAVTTFHHLLSHHRLSHTSGIIRQRASSFHYMSLSWVQLCSWQMTRLSILTAMRNPVTSGYFSPMMGVSNRWWPPAGFYFSLTLRTTLTCFDSFVTDAFIQCHCHLEDTHWSAKIHQNPGFIPVLVWEHHQYLIRRQSCPSVCHIPFSFCDTLLRDWLLDHQHYWATSADVKDSRSSWQQRAKYSCRPVGRVCVIENWQEKESKLKWKGRKDFLPALFAESIFLSAFCH